MLSPTRGKRAAFLWTTLSLLFSLGGSAPMAHAFGDSFGLSPFWDWRTVETDHFRITFPVELKDPATKTADYLEEAHRLLSPLLYWEPRERTQVLVIDNADSANGLAAAGLRIGLVLLVTPPDNWFSTSYYDDWLRMLVIHEYTHFLNMDPVRGWWMETLRVMFGNIIVPNSTWPTWMLEGLAVYMETRMTRKGRGRSPYWDMILRTAVKEDRLSEEFITLDRVNGDNPYFPGGETPYLFGFHLMNQIARTSHNGGTSADGESSIRDGDDLLGVLSYRSAGRVPFFIDENLENLTGRTWKAHWDEWVAETRARAREQLTLIQSQPVTPLQKLTRAGYSALGATPSPDGKWIAFTQGSLDRRSGLYIQDLESGRSRRLMDKRSGVSMVFTPDSKSLLFSAIRRRSNYYQWSDLAIYDLEKNNVTWLTDSLRARDPHLSPGGDKVVFTFTENVSTGIAIARLAREPDGDYVLEEIKKVFVPEMYDRASTPKFAPDGKAIVFSFHKNGEGQEDLLHLDLRSGEVTPLVRDGAMNRFPVYDRLGRLHFISDRSGVDNLYRFVSAGNPLQQITNLDSGLWLPAFGPNGLYGSVFSMDGWDLARISLPAEAVHSLKVTLTPPEAPPLHENVSKSRALTKADGEDKEKLIQDYSVFPSIWPRAWGPTALLFVSPGNSTYLGAMVHGFDATDRHRYNAGLGIDTNVKKLDWYANYANRMLGPTLTFSGSDSTSAYGLDLGGSVTFYTTRRAFSLTASFPFQWTYSALEPFLALSTSREYLYVPGGSEPVDQSQYVPQLSAGLFYSDAESSALGISPEGGRHTSLAGRLYIDSGNYTWKGVLTDTEYVRITDHSVLVPSIKAAWTSSRSTTFTGANVVVRGRLNQWLNGSLSDSLDQLTIRGYPQRAFLTRAAAVGAMDYRFPLLRIYRGWETVPAFLDHLWGFVFTEAAYFPASDINATVLPSVGAGVRLGAKFLIHVPVTFSLEYHHGFREALGGQGELFFGVNVSALQI